MAQVTIEFDEFDTMRRRIAELEAKVIGLESEKSQTRLGDGADDRRVLSEALNAALEVVGFAIANLHPLTVRGWPYQTLRRLGALAAHAPGVPETYRASIKMSWAILADEMERWETARAEGREKEMLAELNAAKAIPADHPIVTGRPRVE